MPIAELVNPNQNINVKTLTIEPKINRDGLPYDPRIDISPGEKQEILRSLEEPYVSIILPAAICLLFPEESESIANNSLLWERIKNRNLDFEGRKKNKEMLDSTSIMMELAFLKLSFPEKVHELNPIIDRYKEEFIREFDWKGSIDFVRIQTFFAYKVLFPLETPDEILEERYPEIREEIKRLGEQHQHLLIFDIYVTELAYTKLLFPHKEIELDEAFWKKARQSQRTEKWPGGWGHFAYEAMNMTILAADEAKITPNGIELLNQPSQAIKSDEMPIERSF